MDGSMAQEMEFRDRLAESLRLAGHEAGVTVLVVILHHPLKNLMHRNPHQSPGGLDKPHSRGHLEHLVDGEHALLPE